MKTTTLSFLILAFCFSVSCQTKQIVKSNSKLAIATNHLNNQELLMAKDLPKEIFGNWYDKYGTLMMIITPDYIVNAIQVWYYEDVKILDNSNYQIKFTNRKVTDKLEVLRLSNDSLTIRTDRLLTFVKGNVKDKVPAFLKGSWSNWSNADIKLKVTDGFCKFGPEEDNFKGLPIDHVGGSRNPDDSYWFFILYKDGMYEVSLASKKGENYFFNSKGISLGYFTKDKN
ncbi:hypothetical protein BFR04_01845 [Gaetbulibacter sp. 4G1]|nr:hypothetical protein [Gaetbulibacter sp. 4G1]PIA79612.1 hypothetical protein BFR04_01845 [Gaetbulibacter sp. 4G1]